MCYITKEDVKYNKSRMITFQFVYALNMLCGVSELSKCCSFLSTISYHWSIGIVKIKKVLY